jgi:hypothetical protein
LLAALLLAALSAPPAVPDADRLMLDSFRAACARTGDLEQMKADAVAAGWEPVADDSDPRIARLNGIGREAMGEDAIMTGGSFRATVAGRDLFLIQSRVEDKDEGYWGVGCRAYDFAASAPFEPSLLERWMGKLPTGVVEPAPGLIRRLWEPGWRPGISVEAAHVPQGHPLGAQVGLQGNILIAQAIGGF